MSEADEIDYALIGCGSTGTAPQVPSTKFTCVKCGGGVWVGNQLLADLHERGYTDDQIRPLCLFTCLQLPTEVSPEITDNQRAELHERGLSDRAIDDSMSFFDEMIQRGDPDVD